MSFLADDSWRWAVGDETWDIYIPAPEYGADCERGVALWRLRPDHTEKLDAEVEWVQSGPCWFPAISRPDGPVVVFDGFSAQMPSVPAGGINLGRITGKGAK